MSVSYLAEACSSSNVSPASDSAYPSVVRIPFYMDSVSAGLPFATQDLVDRTLDLNELCIQHPAATFFVRAQGDSMVDAGIFSDDILVVDRSLTARHGDIVIAAIHGEMTVKSLELTPKPLLRPKNRAYAAIPLTEDSEFEVFGVVTCVVRNIKRGGV